MDHRGQSPDGTSTDHAAAVGSEKKTPNGLLGGFENLWREGQGVCGQRRVEERAQALALSALVCMGRHTVTGLLSACGRQFADWSADYRLFSRGRLDTEPLFGAIRRGIVDRLDPSAPLVIAMDDSMLRKTGAKAHGVSYRRDPLGPPFHVNLVRAQRVLQISAALPAGESPACARMIPIDFCHAPTPKKPGKNASEQAWASYRGALREANINRLGSQRLHHLREKVDQDPGGSTRALTAVVDGRFTNRTMLKDLPQRTTLIGRIRGDANLYHLPAVKHAAGPGRRRVYGDPAPTPEQLRQDAAVPWQTVSVHAAGKLHEFKIKTLAPLRWRAAGKNHDLRLVVIAPLAYRPRKGSRLLYRKPAHLICTDPDLPIQKLVQAYVWRWDIEVNFRDEKTLLGLGQAQVRTPDSVESVPALIAAAYAMLLLAGVQTLGADGLPNAVPLPKWRRNQNRQRASTQDLITHLRAELWGRALGLENFSGFTSATNTDAKPEKLRPPLASAVLYAAA